MLVLSSYDESRAISIAERMQGLTCLTMEWGTVILIGEPMPMHA